jgi:hypothetical protein
MEGRVSVNFGLTVFVVLSVLWPTLTKSGLAATDVETFTGRAVNRTGGLEYVEHHTVLYKNGKVSQSETIYYDAASEQIGDLVSNYSHGPQFGSYSFRDIRAQYEDGAKVQVDQIRLFRRASPEADLEDGFLPKEDNQIVGQGFHQFIVQNLERIAQGEIFHVRLVMPSRLDQYRFRIIKRRIEGNTLYIRLEIDNWFLRLFAPHIDTEYDLQTRRLLRYEGVSNLEDASGKHSKVTITYSYDS